MIKHKRFKKDCVQFRYHVLLFSVCNPMGLNSSFWPTKEKNMTGFYTVGAGEIAQSCVHMFSYVCAPMFSCLGR